MFCWLSSEVEIAGESIDNRAAKKIHDCVDLENTCWLLSIVYLIIIQRSRWPETMSALRAFCFVVLWFVLLYLLCLLYLLYLFYAQCFFLSISFASSNPSKSHLAVYLTLTLLALKTSRARQTLKRLPIQLTKVKSSTTKATTTTTTTPTSDLRLSQCV